MQDTITFLETVWPDTGPYCIATKYPKGGYNHKTFDDIEEAAKYALSQDKDVWFAVGSLKEHQVWCDEKEKFQVRVGTNINQHKALIADLDCGEGKDYPTQPEALQALVKFCTDANFPKPILVSSGGGWHCYWLLSESIPSTDWQRIGNKLKRIFGHYGLKADPTATADVARVLRVPGTFNCKTEVKRPVKVFKWSETRLSASKVESNFDKIIQANSISVPKEKPSNELKALFEGVQTLDKAKADKDQELITSRCPQMQRVVELGGSVGYEMRGHYLSVVKCTFQQDYDAAYEDPNPELVAAQNDAMLEDTITDNPHTCISFENSFPEGCSGCKWKGKVTSPVSLGMLVRDDSERPVTKPEAKLPEELLPTKDPLEFRQEDGIEFERKEEPWKSGTPRFKLPSGYANSEGQLVKNPQQGDEALYPQVICPGIFYPYDVLKDEKGETVAVCYAKTGNSVSKTLSLPLRIFASPTEVAGELASKGMIITGKQAGEMVKYMSSYIHKIQEQLNSINQYAKLGWHNAVEREAGVHREHDPDKFVLPYCAISKEGVVKSGASKKLVHVEQTFGECGSLEVWKDLAKIYTREGYEGYAFGMLAGFGSPLMQFTEYDGAIISMVGDSGSGKSTVLKMINSLFGKPGSYLTQSDTINAFFSIIGTYSSIAVTADELTDLPPERVSQIAYAISQGRDKMALDQNRNVKENDSAWKLLLVSSSNRSLMTKLAEFKKESAAEAYRIFEFNLNVKMHKMTKGEAEELFEPLQHNYGHAGKIYIEYVIKNLSEVKALLKQVRKDVDAKSNASGPERYWTVAVAACITGGIIANRLGLLEFDMDKITDWAVEQIKAMRGNAVENTRGNLGTLSAYLAETIGNTITVGGAGNKAKPFYCLKEPSQRVWNRYEPDNNLMFIDSKALRSFVVDGGGDWNGFRNELAKKRIMIANDRLYVLTKGSGVSTSGQTRCIVIDTSHQEMQSAGGTVLKLVDTEAA